MIITLYYVRIWTEGIWSKKRKGITSVVSRPFRTEEDCKKFIHERLPKYTQRERLEPTWIYTEIVTKKQYIPKSKKAE